MDEPRIFLSAGEPSGDMHGARLAIALRERWPRAQLFGLGGDRMAAAGVELLAHVDQLAVMGLVEVLKHLPYFITLMRRVRATIAKRKPHLIIPIDYPGFNLRLAKHARLVRVPVLYYIAPQVWAWHRSRMKELARNTDRLAVILPFEEKLFRDAGANAHFVGHPLLDAVQPVMERAAFMERLQLNAHKPVLALFPGSRVQEVTRQLDVFAATAAEVQRVNPDVQAVIAQSGAVPPAIYEQTQLRRTRDGWSLLNHATAALVKSGTSTLQAALAQTPMVVTYSMHPLTFAIAQRLVSVPHVGLVNLVAGERVVPELLQDEATPEKLAAALLPLLEDTLQRRDTVAALARVRAALAPPAHAPGAAARVAELAAELLPA